MAGEKSVGALQGGHHLAAFRPTQYLGGAQSAFHEVDEREAVFGTVGIFAREPVQDLRGAGLGAGGAVRCGEEGGLAEEGGVLVEVVGVVRGGLEEVGDDVVGALEVLVVGLAWLVWGEFADGLNGGVAVGRVWRAREGIGNVAEYLLGFVVLALAA